MEDIEMDISHEDKSKYHNTLFKILPDTSLIYRQSNRKYALTNPRGNYINIGVKNIHKSNYDLASLNQ